MTPITAASHPALETKAGGTAAAFDEFMRTFEPSRRPTTPASTRSRPA